MEKKNNKKGLIALVAVLVLAVAALIVWLATRPEPRQGGKEITVNVDHLNGDDTTYTFYTDAEYVRGALEQEELIAGTESDYGLYITTVDGEEAVYEKDGAYWAFYVGEDYASQGVETTPVEDGATYSLVYTTD